ncbi:hypothetical protein SDC9_212478 [bioreactor metagenome]|uniref:Uncharacterized protein n=1 Tax=bioreactor metagenome TaxID=1076179 RepID=A0A645JN41_9ZZZZ
MIIKIVVFILRLCFGIELGGIIIVGHPVLKGLANEGIQLKKQLPVLNGGKKPALTVAAAGSPDSGFQ